VHCEHLSTHLVTGDGREDALVRPGYQLSALNPPGNWRRPRGRPRQTWLHLSTHLVTGDGREDALVRPGSELSNISSLIYIQPTDKYKIVLHGRRLWKQLCSHSANSFKSSFNADFSSEDMSTLRKFCNVNSMLTAINHENQSRLHT